MLPKIDPTETDSWKKLNTHYEKIRNIHLRDLFSKDPARFEKFHIRFNDILLDYSKNRITEETTGLLLELAGEVKLKEAIDAMFSGKAINETENRAVLHTALRNREHATVKCMGKNVMRDVHRVLRHMEQFCDRLHNGEWRGYTDKPVHQIVNIGIGGSDLGPRMVVEALHPYRKNNIESFFISNVDGADIITTLEKCDPETTLFIVASKSFTTQETLENARTARDWFLNAAGDKEYIKKHFVAISTNIDKVTEFGISEDNIFEFWDWVGGRFSLWSAIGLSIACAVGFDNFSLVLEGAHATDIHFRDREFGENIPVMLALLGVWYNNFFQADNIAILPYDQLLNRFPAYLQQADMESNGKRIDRNGKPVSYSTGPVLFGEPGTNGQHSFYQLLHQGTKLIPADFLAGIESNYPEEKHHQILLSNFFAQTEALMYGKTEDQAREELKDKCESAEELEKILPFKLFPGNRPTNSILYRKLTPYVLGSIIAMYEHKIFTQGVIWNIFSFDQWGVELGKQLAGKILTELEQDEEVISHDSSTNGLINYYRLMVKKSSGARV